MCQAKAIISVGPIPTDARFSILSNGLARPDRPHPDARNCTVKKEYKWTLGRLRYFELANRRIPLTLESSQLISRSAPLVLENFRGTFRFGPGQKGKTDHQKR